MACTNPKRIFNRSSNYIPTIDRTYLSVPCGHCQSCRESSQRDWLLRTYYHYLNYKNSGGRIVFLTLTYNNRSLPTFYFNGNVYPCFSKEHIDTYLNSLRQFFKRNYGLGETEGTSINYFVAQEFGSKKGRPHMHILLFFPKFDCSDGVIKYRVKKYWKYGFTYFSPMKVGGAFVDSVNAIKYCSKYVSKDLFYINKKYVTDYIDHVEKKLGFRPLFLKHLLPNHYQSKGFGSILKDVLEMRDDLHDVLEDGIRLPLDEFFYPIPRYIKDKFMFKDIRCVVTDDDDNDHFLRSRSEFSQEHAKYMFSRKLRECVNDLNHKLSFLGLSSSVLSMVHLNSLLHDKLDLEYTFDTINDFRSYLIDALDVYTIEDLAAYNLVLKDRYYTSGSSVDDIYIASFGSKYVPMEWNDVPLKNEDYLYAQTSNLNNLRYAPLQMVSSILDVVYNDFNHRKSLARKQQYDKRQTVIHNIKL